MTQAFKGEMVILTGDQDWRRVRPPLVALTDEEFFHLKQQFDDFSFDLKVD
jgi:hypothetical protein